MKKTHSYHVHTAVDDLVVTKNHFQHITIYRETADGTRHRLMSIQTQTQYLTFCKALALAWDAPGQEEV